MSNDRKTSTLRLRCPHCKRETLISISAPLRADQALLVADPWLLKLNPDVESPRREGADVYIVSSYTNCPESDCEGPIYILMRWELNEMQLSLHSKGGRHYTKLRADIEILAMFPDGRRPTLDSAIPEQIRTEWGGIIELAEHRRSPAFVTVGCRAILEAAVRELERAANSRGMVKPAARKSLQQRIDGLAAASVITHTLKDWAHELRLDGNDGAHELRGDSDRALEFARFVEFFLESTFVMEARLGRIQRLPTSAPDADQDILDELIG